MNEPARVLYRPAPVVSQEKPVCEETTPQLCPMPVEQDWLAFDTMASGPAVEVAEGILRTTLAEAEELFREKRWDDLLALFHPVEQKCAELAETGLDVEIRLKVGFALGQLGRTDEAIACLKRAVELAPDNFMAHSSLAYTAYNSLRPSPERKVLLTPQAKQARIALAHRHFQSSQQLRPDTVACFYRQGMLFKDVERKHSKAAPLFERAIANWRGLSPDEQAKRHGERPKFVRALYHLAACTLTDNRPRKAIALLEQVRVEDEAGEILELVFQHFAMAKALHALGQSAKAIDHLETAAAAARPGEPTDYVWELAARCALTLGQPDRAAGCIARIPERNRRHYVRWTEGDVLVAQGRPADAERIWLASAERDRRSRHRALTRLARLYVKQGRFDKAIEACDHALRFCAETYGSTCPEVLFWKAAALYRLGKAADAMVHVQELKERNFQYPHFYRLVSLVEQANKQGGANACA